jgi:type IV pilus assembly protein PilB
VHEILAVDEGLRKLISAAAPAEQIKEHAANSQGMVSLREAAVILVSEGVTTMEEFYKAAY